MGIQQVQLSSGRVGLTLTTVWRPRPLTVIAANEEDAAAVVHAFELLDQSQRAAFAQLADFEDSLGVRFGFASASDLAGLQQSECPEAKPSLEVPPCEAR